MLISSLPSNLGSLFLAHTLSLAFGEISHKRDKCHSDSVMKFSEINMIKMLEFLNDTLFVVFDGCVFQHTVGIPTSINYASPRSFIHMKLFSTRPSAKFRHMSGHKAVSVIYP
jgi:hypothetical protein